jgi:ribulose-phosphate 3-epimerase
MKIVPALLTDNKKEFQTMLKLCSGFTDYVQVDIMDGEFVASKSINEKDIASLRSPIKAEAHLMAKEPSNWLRAFKLFGAVRIIFHFEAGNNHQRTIDDIRNKDLEVGIAVNPATAIDDFKFLVEKVDAVLFMSVVPGFYGSKFIPAVLEKIKEFKRQYPAKICGIDGGVNLDNIKRVAQSGVDYICIGSAILKAPRPKEAYAKILSALK